MIRAVRGIQCLLLVTILPFFFLKSPAAQPSAVIDATCYKLILDKLYISRDDVTTYKKIFRAIKDEDWEEVEDLSEDLDSDLLMGHVLAETYLSKTYVSTFAELKDWLEKYGDYPQAPRIYRLARRKGDKAELPSAYDAWNARRVSPYDWYDDAYEAVRPKDKEFVRRQMDLFVRALNQGKTLRAKRILENRRMRMVVPDRYWDAMSATLATEYFLDNRDKLAIEWTTKPTRRSRNATALWIRGLAFWRQGKYAEAGINFRRLGGLKDNDEWLISAGAYWAYRSYEKAGQKTEAKKQLHISAKYRRTFYGILANFRLGNSLKYNWDSLAYLNDFSNYDYVNDLLSSAAIRRAIILLHAKNPDLAEQELRADFYNMNEKQKEAALYMAQQYKMHALGIMISNQIKNNEREIYYDCVAYPVPSWKPKSGWKVDKALVWALVRQESAFKPTAQSGAGAKGLMQLLSSTAFYVTKDRRLKENQASLFDAELNLDAGQRYVSYLLEKPYIDGNLFYLAAAYNAGPGNLQKWKKFMRYQDDPLMFIETIPARQTRIYIERVLANYWIYNERFGQQSKSLEQLAHDQWPTL